MQLLVRDELNCPATSMSVERMFKDTTDTITAERASLLPANAERVVLCRSNALEFREVLLGEKYTTAFKQNCRGGRITIAAETKRSLKKAVLPPCPVTDAEFEAEQASVVESKRSSSSAAAAAAPAPIGDVEMAVAQQREEVEAERATAGVSAVPASSSAAAPAPVWAQMPAPKPASQPACQPAAQPVAAKTKDGNLFQMFAKSASGPKASSSSSSSSSSSAKMDCS